jgi:hypothetical protein
MSGRVTSGAKWAGRRALMRSRWLANKLWVITVAEVLWLARRHWQRLEPDERARLMELVRESRARPGKLKRSQREELQQLLDKLGHWEFAGGAVRRSVPFAGGVLARLLPKNRRPEAAEPEPADEGGGDTEAARGDERVRA